MIGAPIHAAATAAIAPASTALALPVTLLAQAGTALGQASTTFAQAGTALGQVGTTVAQAGGDGGEFTVTFETGLVVFGLALATVVLGLYISYQAYRGYRRNRSRPMLFLAIGIVLLTLGPALFSTVAANVPQLQSAGVVLGFASRLAGLLAILYAIKYA